MSLTTLQNVKTQLGISDTSEDVQLTNWLAAASMAIREHCSQYLYGVLGAIVFGSSTSITCPGHGLETGDVIQIVGSGTTPSIDGAQTVTVVDPFTFTVPVATSAVSTNANVAGIFARQYTEYYSGSGNLYLMLRRRPVQSIATLIFDEDGYFGTAPGAFSTDQTTQTLVEGADFVLQRDNCESNVSLTGKVIRINGCLWYRPSVRFNSLLAISRGDAIGNIKVTYLAGYTRPLSNVMLAAAMYVGQLRSAAASGVHGPASSLKYDYFQVQRDFENEGCAMDSVKHLLRRYRQWNV